MSPESLRDDVGRLMHRGSGVRDFALSAARILARAVPFEGVCVLTLDPETLVATGEIVDNGLPPAALARLAEIELGGDDFNAFQTLALSHCHTATLSQVTGGDLDRSERHREVRAPHGFGDELRAVLVDEGTAWGALTLLRGADREPFRPADAELVEAVTRHLAEGLRRALLLGRDASETAEADDGVGVVVLAPDGSTTFVDERALAWMDELDSNGARPPVVTAVASRARTLAAGHGCGCQIARARVRARSGQWLVVRASLLGDEPGARVAVMIEPAQPHELAPLLAGAYRLSDREREVTQLVARGLPTDAVAARLHLSPWTVQDHLKAIFEKVGVATRGELVARLYFRHRTPRL